MRGDSANKNAEISQLVSVMGCLRNKGCLLTYVVVYKIDSFSSTMTLQYYYSPFYIRL